MKRGGKEQHSKIGPVNNGEDVVSQWQETRLRVGEETKRARLHAVVELRVRESARGKRDSETEGTLSPSHF